MTKEERLLNNIWKAYILAGKAYDLAGDMINANYDTKLGQAIDEINSAYSKLSEAYTDMQVYLANKNKLPEETEF